MTTRILVTYATRYGSTQEVAEAIARTMIECGLQVDVKPVREVRTLAGHEALVLGGPLFMYHWHKDALHFLARQRSALAGEEERSVPVAIFAGGPIGKGDAAEWQMSRGQLDANLAHFPWLKPVDTKIVGGKFDRSRVGFPMNLFTKQVQECDLRDWDDIRGWARALARTFTARSAAASAA